MATTSEKLKDCEVCGAKEAKYTCPKCEVRTCSIPCVNIHKQELDCDGIRDKTKFIPLNSFTNLDLLSDYRLLEDIGRNVEQLQNNPLKKCTRQINLPHFLQVLRNAAFHRGVRLEFMPQNFSRHKDNTTYLNYKSNEISWRVEFIFSHAENTKWTIDKVLETKRLSTVLEQVLNPDFTTNANNEDYQNRLSLLQSKLKFYQARGLSGLTALLKAERVQKSDSRFYELDLTLSLRENLKNKTIIEYPSIYIAFKDHLDMFEIVESDDEEIRPPPVPRERRGKRRFPEMKEANKNEKTVKEKVDSTSNYFFNAEITDSEDEEEKVNTFNKNTGQLNIPDYDQLVKM